MVHQVSATVYLLHIPLSGLPGPEVFRAAGRTFIAALARLSWPTPVVIKPNVVWNEPADSGIVTHPAFVAGLVAGLLEQGVQPTEIIVAEGGGVEEADHDMTRFYETAGYTAELAPYGVQLRDLNLDRSVVLVDPQRRILRELHVARTIVEAGTLLNVPKMKTHNFATVTLSVKNMQGMLTPLPHRHLCTLYPRYESDDGQGLDPRVLDKPSRFYHKLVDLAMGIRPDLHIVEGIVGRDGTGFHQGKNIPMGLVLAGSNPFAVDQVGAMLMGFTPEKVGFLRAAAERGLWDLDPRRIAVMAWRDERWIPCPEWQGYAADPPFRLLRREGLQYKEEE